MRYELKEIKALRLGEKYYLRPYEYDSRIWVIDIPKKSVKGIVNGKENLILANWWALFFGLLTNADWGNVLDQNGSNYTIRSSGDVSWRGPALDYGSGTTPEQLSDYKLAGYISWFNIPLNVGYSSDRSRLTFSAVLPSNASEIGIFQSLYDTSGYTHGIQLTRTVTGLTANSGIAYYLDFYKPWLYHTALLMYGVHLDADVSGFTDIGGVTFTGRTSLDVNAGMISFAVSETPITWSPTLTTLTNPINMTSRWYGANNRVNAYLMLTGELAPTNALNVQTIGLIQSLYDTGGTAHTTLMGALDLPSPITFDANKLNMIVIRIIIV